MHMWQSVCAGRVVQPPKWRREHYTRPSNVPVIHKTTRSCKASSDGAGSRCEKTDDESSRSSGGGTPMIMPPLPKSVRLKIAAVAAARQRGTRSQLSSLGGLQSPANPIPDATGVRSADVTMDDASPGLWARVFSPAATAHRPLPVVVYFHGGGFVSFSPASRPYDAFCRRLCRELRAVVVSVSYRLAPSHRFPAAYDDGVAALRYLAANNSLPAADVAPINISSCFLAGDSSGGNIAHHVAHRWSSMTPSSSSTKKNLHVAGVVLIQPLFGGEERTAAELDLADACPTLTLATADHYWREFLPEGATRDHVAARVDGKGAGASFPPTMVVVGGFDLLKDRHLRYVEELRQRKKNPVRMVEYPDAIHGFYIFPEIADSGKFMADLKLFVQEYTGRPLTN